VIEQQAVAVREVSRGSVHYLEFEHLLRFPSLVHAIFLRHGGYSRPPFDGLNVSFKEDQSEAVAANRLLVLQTLGLEALPCATLWQVHGAEVAIFEHASWEDWRTDWPYRTLRSGDQELLWTPRPRRKADAIVTSEREVVLIMAFADCLPLLFYDPCRQVIALAHAGWRGSARGIALATVEAMSRHFGCRPADLLVGIGPGIGACCYSVGEQVRDLFYGTREFEERPVRREWRSWIAESAVFSTVKVPGRGLANESESGLHLDLWETNRRQLLLAGVAAEHIAVAGLCTFCHHERFYSYRAAGGRTGRFPVLMALRSSGEQAP
jgi:YfiH family protein